MSISENDHLSEEELAEIVSGNTSESRLKHLKSCSECSRKVTDLSKIESALSSIEDYEIPRTTEREIMFLSNKTKWGNFQQLLSNPLLGVFITIIMIVLIYFLVGSEILK